MSGPPAWRGWFGPGPGEQRGGEPDKNGVEGGGATGGFEVLVALVACEDAEPDGGLTVRWPPRALVKQATSVWPDLPQKEHWRSAGWWGQLDREWVESPHRAHFPTINGGI